MRKADLKAQGAFEFLLLVGVTLTATVIILLASSQDINEIIAQRDYLLLKEQGDMIAQEASLAVRVEDGYKRSFRVPTMIGNRDFTLITQNRTVTLTTDRATYATRIPTIQGNFTKGVNNITKIQGLVRLN